jgi:hypothetical protein
MRAFPQTETGTYKYLVLKGRASAMGGGGRVDVSEILPTSFKR